MTHVVASRKWGSMRLVLPGCDKCTEDHGEDGQLDGHGEGLPGRNRWNISVIRDNNKEQLCSFMALEEQKV